MTSSMAAACNRLWGQHDPAFLFALVSVQQRHDDASYDFEQRMFQLNSHRYYCPQCSMHNKLAARKGLTDLSRQTESELVPDKSICLWALLGRLSLQTCTSKYVLHLQMAWLQRAIAVCYKISSQHLCQPECCICSHKIEPVDMHIRCVGQAGSLSQRYQPVVRPPMFARVPSFTHKITSNVSQHAKETSQSSVEVSSSMLRSVAYTGLKNQIEAVESIYRKTVRQLEQMAHQAGIESAP